MRIGLDFAQVLPEQVRAKAVDAGVDHADGQLLRRAVLLLDDGLDVRRGRRRSRGHSRRDRRESVVISVAAASGIRLGFAQAFQRGGGKQRRIAVEHHQEPSPAASAAHVAATLNRVAGALLRLLPHETDALGLSSASTSAA